MKSNFYDTPNSYNNQYKTPGSKRDSINGTAEERSVAGAKFQDKFKNAMNREKHMYTSKVETEAKDPKSNATKKTTNGQTSNVL